MKFIIAWLIIGTILVIRNRGDIVKILYKAVRNSTLRKYQLFIVIFISVILYVIMMPVLQPVGWIYGKWRLHKCKIKG